MCRGASVSCVKRGSLERCGRSARKDQGGGRPMQAYPRLWSQSPDSCNWRRTRVWCARTRRRMRTEKAQRTQCVVALHTLREIGTDSFLMVMSGCERLRDQQSQGQRQNSAAPQQAELVVAPLKHIWSGNLSQPRGRCNLHHEMPILKDNVNPGSKPLLRIDSRNPRPDTCDSRRSLPAGARVGTVSHARKGKRK